ncbi:prolyl-tRNA synthetase [Candidatus Parcubacteria bacterium]|nr:prolyl-tRNA synthetase [Candidatus Parcubacteria bacterium]
MRQSQLFAKTVKSYPKDELSFNAQILIKAGFIDKVSAGVYTFLPLGLLTLNKICDIIRKEMNKIGGQEILMPALTPKNVWDQTGRWDNFDALFKLKGVNKKEYALGATHEEIITPLMKKFVFSYKELPVYIYQIQQKFRNELRAKSGLLRGREFLMKDLYSFHISEENLNNYYEKAQDAYFKIFDKCGLKDLTYLTFASGGVFAKYSHEFQTLSKAGEDTIYICDNCRIAVNKEIINEQKICPNCANSRLHKEKAIEVGNIFKLGTKFSNAFNFKYISQEGEQKDVIMGCYGMGPSRIMATIAEIFNDDKGIIWPEAVAPFRFHLISLNQNSQAEKLYQDLKKAGIEILYDDREDSSAGEKFADADLIGCPCRGVVSKKTLEKNSVEIKKRDSAKCEFIKLDKVIEFFA